MQSDLDNQLHIGAVPMLAVYGFPHRGGSAQGLEKRWPFPRCEGGIHRAAGSEPMLSSAGWIKSPPD